MCNWGLQALTIEKEMGEDRWYTPDEWKGLPKDKQASICKSQAARRGKGKPPGKGQGPHKGKPAANKFGCKSFNVSEKKVQNQKHQLAALQAVRSPTEEDKEDEPTNGNSDTDNKPCKHLALTLQGTVPCKANC
jgi:hypothetical protein